jgi:hypothetical protein
MLREKLIIECESKVDLIDVEKVIQILNDSVGIRYRRAKQKISLNLTINHPIFNPKSCILICQN